MRTITLWGESHKSLDDFFEDISTQLEFPSHFMHNLTDFQECLNNVVPSNPVTIVWKNYAHARMVFGVSVMGLNYLPEVLRILEDTKGLTLVLE